MRNLILLIVMLNSLTIFSQTNLATIDSSKMGFKEKSYLTKSQSKTEDKNDFAKINESFLQNLNDSCPPVPNWEKVNSAICTDIAGRNKAPEAENQYYEYYYQKRLLEAACVNVHLDSADHHENWLKNEEKWIKKLQIFWEKYKTKCKCASLSFELHNGNILKYALAQQMPEFIETLALTYNLDINFIDPKDGLNLMDYLLNEIEKAKKLSNSEGLLKVYNEYLERIIEAGAKPSKK